MDEVDLPSKDWIHQFDEFTRTNYRASTYMDPYAAESDRMLMEKGWFDVTMPDLTEQSPCRDLSYPDQPVVDCLQRSRRHQNGYLPLPPA